MQRRIGIGFVLIAALAMPASAHASHLSPSDFKNASKFCKAVRAEIGTDQFRQTYGTNENRRNAHGKCVSKHARTLDRVEDNAVKQCRAERDADPVAFLQKYGDDTSASKRPEGRGRGNRGEDDSDRSARRALRNCVRQKVREAIAERREAVENAVQQCRTERTANPELFRETYGTNENKRNAFGRCVSSKVRAETQKA